MSMNDLWQCVNKRCKRFRIGVVEQKRCSECGRKLKPFYTSSGREPGDFDTPPDNYQGNNNNGRQLSIVPAGYFSGYRGGYQQSYQASRDRASRGHVEMVTKTIPSRLADDVWSAEGQGSCADVENCPIAVAPKVELPLKIYNEWVFLCCQFKVEWLAYCKGEQTAEGNWRITSYYFPKQVVNGAHVDVDQEWLRTGLQEDTIASVHSHVDMSAFFSGEDKKHFNHQVEMVINRAGNMDCNVRITLDCGKPSRKGSSIILVDAEQDPMWFLKQQLDAQLIEEKPAESMTFSSQAAWGGHYDSV